MLGVTILLLAPLGPADVQLGIALVGKTHAAVELHRPVAGVQQRLGGMGLGHAAGDFRVPVQGFLPHQGGGVVDKGAPRIHRAQNVHCGVFQCLVGAYQLAELLAGLEILHDGIQAAGSAAGGLRRSQQRAQQVQVAQGAADRRPREQVLLGDLYAAEIHAGAALGLVDQGIGRYRPGA